MQTPIRNNIVLFVCVILCFLTTFLNFLNANQIKVGSQCSISSVKQAIIAAKKWDTIIIQNGNYKERNIVVNKPLTIIGENFPVIDGENNGQIFLIKADSVTIKGLQIQNVGTSYVEDRAGIRVSIAKNCLIENNKLFNTFFGIYLAKSENCIIRGNEVTGIAKNETEAGNAIHLWYCKKMLVENNHVTGHRDGIYFEFVTESKIFNNISTKQIRYGMHFMFSHSNEYFHNRFTDNDAGVAVMYSSHIYMHENIFADNWSTVSNGILLKEISDSRIEENIFEHNTIGVYAEGCARLEIKHNNFTKNGWAVKIMGDCEDNRFDENNFTANTFDVVTNSSLSHNLFEKNFWSEYTGYDLDKNGVGDVPFRPVKLFTYIVENIPPAIILLRSLFIDLLNLAEKVTPVITPETLTDNMPMMKEIKW
ncbi:MAG: nitrous oxide reductase family maturation protein NosD [Bacteroidetes bacterium]|nr:nitrous oxide reductase family maturation protein NosD [Bacteroidota bacterium]